MSDARALLDFPGCDGRRLAFTAPRATVEARSLDEVRPALREVERAARAGAWAAGFVAYEAAPAFDSALAVLEPAGPAPLLWFGIFDAPAVAAAPGSAVRAAGDGVGAAAGAAVGAAGDADAAVPADAVALPRLDWQCDTERAAYDAAIARIRTGIAAGDFYQVNLTVRFRTTSAPAALPLYNALVAQRHGLHHALIESADWAVVSASPELFLDFDGSRLVTRPMKGTVRRGRWTEEDEAAAAELATSPKDRAENLMIVDLLRNDLGRIAEFGSVRVDRLFDVETYPTVHQLTSTISARVRDGTSLDDVFAATFPCGSITGAPKVAAMRAIAQLEHAPRGAYCGAIGVVRPDGTFTFNVGIRTILLDHRAGTACYGAGGGITWDSSADAEYDEVVAKATLLTETIPEFELIETLRLDDGAYARLPLHLARLAASARYWGFADDVAAHAAAALDAERAAVGTGTWRVRLTAARDGTIGITRTPLDHDTSLEHDTWLEHHASLDHDPSLDHDTSLEQGAALGRGAVSAGARSVALADTPVSRSDRLLFHKTTARAVYDTRRAARPDAWDVLLWNEEREVTEFTTGNVVVRIGSQLYTPPLDCGLLPGRLREELLRSGTVRERVIPLDELRAADAVWFINSVRGTVPVTIEAAADAVPAGEATGG